MIAEGRLGIPIFTVDTGRLLPETHDLIERTMASYGVNIAVYSPNSADVEMLVKRGGINLFRNSAFERDLCCEARKTKPLRRAQVGLDAWIRSSRGDRDVDSAAPVLVEWDAGGLVKIDPLATWDDAGVWDYVRAHAVPCNPLYDQGFESIDCAPCARRR
jgi:phosphoadenosine phosphosulfate reductase